MQKIIIAVSFIICLIVMLAVAKGSKADTACDVLSGIDYGYNSLTVYEYGEKGDPLFEIVQTYTVIRPPRVNEFIKEVKKPFYIMPFEKPLFEFKGVSTFKERRSK